MHVLGFCQSSQLLEWRLLCLVAIYARVFFLSEIQGQASCVGRFTQAQLSECLRPRRSAVLRRLDWEMREMKHNNPGTTSSIDKAKRGVLVFPMDRGGAQLLWCWKLTAFS